MNTNTTTILLIDDDDDDRMLFKEALREISPSITIVEKTDCDEATDFLKSMGNNCPDYIFVDLNLPGTPGLKCLESIKEMKACENIPVYMYSTQITGSTKEKAFASGAAGAFQKPFTFDGIVTLLKGVLKLPAPTQ